MSSIQTFSSDQATIQYLEAILDNLREPLLVLNNNLQIITCNQAFLTAFDLSRNQTLNQKLFELEHQHWQQGDLHQCLNELLDQGRAFQGIELQRNFARTGLQTYLINGQILPVPGSDQAFVLLELQDVTERRVADLKLQAYTEKLQRSNQELQDFASITSHDLQEPLRKIQAFGDLLSSELGSGLNETAKMYLDRMQNAAKRMHILINDLLAYSRLSTRVNPLVEVNLESIVNDVLSDLEIHIRDTQAKITVSLAALNLKAEPLQMRMLIQNLTSNALKFHQPNTPPEILITLCSLPPTANLTSALPAFVPMCELRVKDNGIGFDEKYLSKIFTIFQRLHYRHEYEGTGVGLAICRKIVDRHGGTITAISQPNQGSTFVVTLPLNPQILES